LENKTFKGDFKSSLLGSLWDTNLQDKIYLTRHTTTIDLQDRFGNHQSFLVQHDFQQVNIRKLIRIKLEETFSTIWLFVKWLLHCTIKKYF